MYRLGLDVGGVLTDQHRNDGTDTCFRSDNFLNTTPVPGMFEAVTELVQMFTPPETFIVSKCGEVIEDKTRKWLPHIGFYDRTGFNPAHLNFCPTREGKVPIARRLGLTHFVDDREDVLGYLERVVPYRFLLGWQNKQIESQPGLYVVRTWEEAVTAIKETMR